MMKGGEGNEEGERHEEFNGRKKSERVDVIEVTGQSHATRFNTASTAMRTC
jgi:hypothetical protein